jgi:hypothetical protein
MLGTRFGLIALIFGVVLRYDPEARFPASHTPDPPRETWSGPEPAATLAS